MSENEIATLVKEAHEAKLLKQLLEEKLHGYGGIKNDELELICSMSGIRRGASAA